MTPDRTPRRPVPVTSDRYRLLQIGYREALLAQLDVLVTELLEEGDFTPQQVETALRLRLEGGREALRHHKLAEELAEAPPSP